jgi:hypothetical protein
VLTFLALMSYAVAVVLSFLGLSVRNMKDKERAELRERTDPDATFSTDCKIFTLIFGDHDGILLGYDDRIELVTMKLKKKPIMLDKITEIEDLGVDLEDPELHSIPRKLHLFALWKGPISINKLAVIDGPDSSPTSKTPPPQKRSNNPNTKDNSQSVAPQCNTRYPVTIQ